MQPPLSKLKLAYLSTTRRLRLGRSASEPVLVVLIYHRVGSGTDSPIDVPLSVFQAQLAYLVDHFDVVSLDRAEEVLRTTGLQHNMAVLTFDDGYHDFCTNVVPALQERNLPATLYPATRFIDAGDRFPWDAPFESHFPSVRPMTLGELEEVARVPIITVGSHTHNHPRLDRLRSEDMKQEIVNSITYLETHLGFRPAHFACPNGLTTPTFASMAPDYFRTVVVGGWRPNVGSRAEVHRLFRIPAIPTNDLALFAHSLTGAGRLIDFGEKLRYRLLP